LSVFGDISAHIGHGTSLKTPDIALETCLQVSSPSLQEDAVIVVAILAAILVLAAVTLISSIASSNSRHR
jgi:hypothetical protein